MSDLLTRLVPPGTSRAKLVTAVVLVVAALGVLAYDVAWFLSDAPEWPDMEAQAYEAELPAGESAAGDVTPDASLFAAGSPDASAADALVTPSAASGDTSAVAATRSAEPDWAALFAQLLERADGLDGQAVDGAGARAELDAQLARVRLRGLASDAQGGVALVDGRFLRVGDTLPGTRLVLTSIQRDRVLLAEPGRSEPVVLLLEAFASARSTDV